MHLTRGQTALRKSVDRIKIGSTNVGFIHERPFFHQHFSMKIDGIFKNCSCFIVYRLLMLYRILLNFCIWQEDHTAQLDYVVRIKIVKNVGVINERHFLYRHFCIKIDRILRIAHVSSTIGYWCFIGSF